MQQIIVLLLVEFLQCLPVQLALKYGNCGRTAFKIVLGVSAISSLSTSIIYN
jgi:hypothetical protein